MSGDVAKTAQEWVFVATSAEKMAESQSVALRCMVMAVLAAERVSDWLMLARTRAQAFHDPELARQCMANAEAHAEDFEDEDDWTVIGDVWAELGYPSKAVQIAREQFEPMPWPHLDDLTKSVGEFPPGTTVLDWVEQGMTERAIRDLLKIASEQGGSSYTDVAWKVVSAEHFADCSLDWTRIAKAWMENLNNVEEAKRCMQEAEDAVDVRHDWILIARAWKEDFGDIERAIRCIVADLGVLTSSPLTDQNTWEADCESDRRSGSYSEHYSFTLAEAGEVTIELSSEEDNSILCQYLIEGNAFTGEVLEEAWGEFADDDDGETYSVSRICRSLSNGTYTVEATCDWPAEFNFKIFLGSTS